MKMDNEPRPAGLRVLRGPLVYGPTGKTGKSRSQVYADIAAGTFPPGFMISGTQRGWLESDIDEWILARARNHPAGAPREHLIRGLKAKAEDRDHGYCANGT